VVIEVSEDEHLAGKASSDAFADPIYEVPECGQAAVGGNVYCYYRYSGPLDRDAAVAVVEQNTGGAECWRPCYDRRSVQVPDPVGSVRDKIRLSHRRKGDAAIPDGLEEQVLRPPFSP
jgi:hypothetical protein